MSDYTEISDAIRLGAAIANHRQIEKTCYTVVPNQYKVESLEALQVSPNRVKASPSFDCVNGFAGYVTEFAIPGSKLFVKLTEVGLIATTVIDYHGGFESPSWCSWTAKLTRTMAKEWGIWRGSSGKWMNQVDMAEFLHDNLPDVVSPPGAEMLELCSQFKQVTAVEFGSGCNIQNGAIQISYVETVGGAVGPKGNLQIPAGFNISIPVIDRGMPIAIACRFRYRVSEKKLLLRYDIPQVHKILEAVMNLAVVELEELTKLKAFLGQP